MSAPFVCLCCEPRRKLYGSQSWTDHRTIGGASFIVKNFLIVAARWYDLPYVIFPMFLAMASLMLWLLIKGVNRAQWDAKQTAVAIAGR
jgi:hypothetical protein